MPVGSAKSKIDHATKEIVLLNIAIVDGTSELGLDGDVGGAVDICTTRIWAIERMCVLGGEVVDGLL